MGELLFFIIFSIPAIYGLAELIHILRGYIITPKAFAPKYLIVFLGDNSPYEQLVCAFTEFSWYGRKYAHNIIAVDCGVSEKDYTACEEYCKKNNMIFCSSDQLSGYLDVVTGKI
ncbi:MAG: hypothetical protein J6D52_06505 [Clostridia bacterium]|nr:hypothetical protein [Clostridia bacterium]